MPPHELQLGGEAHDQLSAYMSAVGSRDAHIFTCALCFGCKPTNKRTNVEQHIWSHHSEVHGGPAKVYKYRASQHKAIVAPYVIWHTGPGSHSRAVVSPMLDVYRYTHMRHSSSLRRPSLPRRPIRRTESVPTMIVGARFSSTPTDVGNAEMASVLIERLTKKRVRSADHAFQHMVSSSPSYVHDSNGANMGCSPQPIHCGQSRSLDSPSTTAQLHHAQPPSPFQTPAFAPHVVYASGHAACEPLLHGAQIWRPF